jgi:hypothetical protein
VTEAGACANVAAEIRQSTERRDYGIRGAMVFSYHSP